MQSYSDAERVVAGGEAKNGGVDLVHVQGDAVQRAVVGLVWDVGGRGRAVTSDHARSKH